MKNILYLISNCLMTLVDERTNISSEMLSFTSIFHHILQCYPVSIDLGKCFPSILHLIYVCFTPGGGGGDSHMKQMGMLVISLRGVNFGFWSHLGQSTTKVSFRVPRRNTELREEKRKSNYLLTLYH